MKRLSIVTRVLLLALFSSGCTVSPGIGEYTVFYHGNTNTGGTVPTDNNRYQVGETVAVLGNTGNLIKTGYDFDGWNSLADGSGTAYLPGHAFPMANGDLDLYARWKSYAIGDTGPAGGIVFYDKGSFSNGWRYLESAPYDQAPGGHVWYSTTSTTGATGTAVGDGETNTAQIVSMQGGGYYAAQICNDLVLNGYSDWFLPSLDELMLMWQNIGQHGVGAFWDGYPYWSSSEVDASGAWSYILAWPGVTNGRTKNNIALVRAIRAF